MNKVLLLAKTNIIKNQIIQYVLTHYAVKQIITNFKHHTIINNVSMLAQMTIHIM